LALQLQRRHQSGPAQQPFRQWAPRELLEVAYRHPLLFPPGSAFDYSNTNTVLLGMVVEKVSGQSLASFIEQHILQPVGMIRTVFPAGAEMPSPHARGYFKMPDGKVVDATDWNPSWGWASGNMISTLEDMRVWARDFAMGKLLSPVMKRERDRFLPTPRKATARYTVWRSKTRTAGSDTMATS
jgi:D-alanyl-D-alanine carboxypeptidase